MTGDAYTSEQAHALEDAAAGGDPVRCPVCDVVMDRRAVPPRRDVSYVRSRVLLVCPTCHRTHVLDRAEKR